MAEPNKCRLLMRERETRDVQRFTFSRPEGLNYQPGQGMDLALDLGDWRDEWRPFTPTSLTGDEVLQFIIKAYPEHDGVTTRLHELEVGDTVLIKKPFGTIQYKGPGAFIAGGAGITPFLSIVRDLAAHGESGRNTLLFANKTSRDIICRNELFEFFAPHCHFILSEEDRTGYLHGRVDRQLLGSTITDLSQMFYLCGPPGFIDAVGDALDEMGVAKDKIVMEEA